MRKEIEDVLKEKVKKIQFAEDFACSFYRNIWYDFKTNEIIDYRMSIGEYVSDLRNINEHPRDFFF